MGNPNPIIVTSVSEFVVIFRQVRAITFLKIALLFEIATCAPTNTRQNVIGERKREEGIRRRGLIGKGNQSLPGNELCSRRQHVLRRHTDKLFEVSVLSVKTLVNAAKTPVNICYVCYTVFINIVKLAGN